MLKKLYKKIVPLLVSLLLPISVVRAAPGGDLNLTNKASLVSRTGFPLILGSQSTEGIKLNINGTEVATFTVSGIGLNAISTTTSPFVFTFEGDVNRKMLLGASNDTTHFISFGDAGTTATQSLTIRSSTLDGDDDGTICLAGGGACSSDQGSYIQARGEESSGGGDLNYDVGAGDIHFFKVAGTTEFQVQDDYLGIAGTSPMIGKVSAGGDLTIGGGIVNSAASGSRLYLESATAAGTGDAMLSSSSGANADVFIGLNGAGSDFDVQNLSGVSLLTISQAGTTTLGNSTAATRILNFGNAGTTATQSLEIKATTSDSDDDSTLYLAGGGAVGNPARGAYVNLNGEQAGSILDLAAGTGGTTRHYVGSTLIGTMSSTGLTLNSSGARITQKYQSIAGAGTLQSDATVATEFLIEITSGAGNSGIKIPVTVAGDTLIIKNNTANTIKIWPQVGGSVGAGTDGAKSITTGQMCIIGFSAANVGFSNCF